MLNLLQSIIFMEISLFLIFQIVKTVEITVCIGAVTAVVHSHVFFFSSSVKWIYKKIGNTDVIYVFLIIGTCSESRAEISHKHNYMLNYIPQTNRNYIHHNCTYSVSVLTSILVEKISRKELLLNLSEGINSSLVSLYQNTDSGFHLIHGLFAKVSTCYIID